MVEVHIFAQMAPLKDFWIMNKKFTLEVSSDLDYERMVINLNYLSDQVAVLSCDQGLEHAIIEILDRTEEKNIWSFDLLEFLNAIQQAYEKLKQVNTPEDADGSDIII
jgi:hypothetical protein